MGIGTLLLDRGLINKEQLELALAEQRQSGERLDRVMVRLGSRLAKPPRPGPSLALWSVARAFANAGSLDPLTHATESARRRSRLRQSTPFQTNST
jgi:hypothetical protein